MPSYRFQSGASSINQSKKLEQNAAASAEGPRSVWWKRFYFSSSRFFSSFLPPASSSSCPFDRERHSSPSTNKQRRPRILVASIDPKSKTNYRRQHDWNRVSGDFDHFQYVFPALVSVIWSFARLRGGTVWRVGCSVELDGRGGLRSWRV